MDCVVTVPMAVWSDWIAEGCLPGDDVGRYDVYDFYCGGACPDIKPGERVYIVAYGRLRGYAPLVSLRWRGGRGSFIRQGGAVAVTIGEPIRGFRGWRYRFWDREDERLFPDWRTAGVPQLAGTGAGGAQ